MQRLRRFIVGVITLAVTLGLPVQAHHGGGIYFQRDQRVGPVTGTATKFSFRFPHISIYFDGTDEQGNVKQYAMSIRWTPTVLRKLGWNRHTIKPGDQLTVTYVPHKEKPTHGALTSLKVNGVTVNFNPEVDE